MLRRFVINSIIFFSGIAMAHAQEPKKSNGKLRGKSYSYYIMRPSQPSRGLVLLMPSRGEDPKKLFWHTAIPRYLAAQGFITIVPKVDYALILEEETKNILDHVTATESTRAALPTSCLLIGGFSSGGAIAAHYAEYRLLQGGQARVKGVFLIDPPLDLARFYNAWTKLIKSRCPEVIISEGKFIKKYVEGITGGTPEEMHGNYLKHSAFTATDSSGGNAIFLRNVPIRLYTEPDLKAMQNKYCNDLSYQNLNASDLDALYARLTNLGNVNVEYIKTTGRGFHSWNIADPDDLARWAERLIPEK